MLFYSSAQKKYRSETRSIMSPRCVWLCEHVVLKSLRLEVRPRSTSDEFPSRVIIEDNLHVKNALLSLNQGNFAKFCMAVSFTFVDLKFLVQQSFSLTL